LHGCRFVLYHIPLYQSEAKRNRLEYVVSAYSL